MTTFLAFLRKNDDGTYTVEFPDLPGCVTAGENLGLVSALAGEDLARHLTTLINFGYPPPSPSSEEQLAHDPRRGAAELMAFEVDLELLGIANPLIYHTL
jgi:predicted RNase H-like HicB family nuclease